ncbi:MAG: hypothetical protein M9918_07965 [Anaerolineae bacterium]|nr:hypothetical protein [Anaerolineae bacterium]
MTTIANLHITLRSDTTFGRGDGVAGLVDQEIVHNPKSGLPFVRGRTLKGLLVEECANILFVVPSNQTLEQAAKFLFGDPGSHLMDDAMMRVGAAHLPLSVRDAVAYAIADKQWTAHDVLESLTAIRRQTSVDNQTGVPEKGSLRAMRVLMRETNLTSELVFGRKPTSAEWALLAACVAGLRRGGTGRNRGRGRLQAVLEDEATMEKHLDHFQVLIGVGA